MLSVRAGYAIYYFCFDIGDEVELNRAEQLVAGKREVREERLKPEYLRYAEPPLYLALKGMSARIGRKRVAVRVDAKVYNFGALTVRFWLPVAGSLAAVGRQAAAFEKTVPLREKAVAEARRLARELRKAISAEGMSGPTEYVLFAVKRFAPRGPADQLPAKHWKEIGHLLKREERVLSFQELVEAKEGYSYYPDELVVVDWGAALVIDPRGTYDVLDVLEYALLELLELRVYEQRLDRILDKAYEDVGKRRLWRQAGSLNELLAAQADIADIVSKLENALKPIGDQYLAKVYRAASREFGLEQWKHSVQHKLGALKDIYLSLAEHMEAQRLLFIEVFMLVIFVVEFWIIVLDFLK